METRSTPNHDRALGMDQRISRRDFLNSSLLAAGGALMSPLCPLDLLACDEASAWDGFSGVGDYRNSNGDTYDVMTEGHRIREPVSERALREATDTKELFDCVIVGGGISGLAAALFFERQTIGKPTCLVLDNRPVFGGQAQRNEFIVDGQRLMAHQASTLFFPPLRNTSLADFYQSIGIDQHQFEYQSWGSRAAEMPVGNTPYTEGGKNSGFYFGSSFGQRPGRWVIDPWGTKLAGAPISAQARTDLLRIQSGPVPGQDSPPKSHGDARSRYLTASPLNST